MPLSKSGGPPQFYSFHASTDPSLGFVEYEQISTRTGLGTRYWTLNATADPEFGGGPCPFGLAFDVDGSMYTIVNWLDGNPAHAKSQLARVDKATGAVTYVGQPIRLHFAGPDIDAYGNLYATGFTEGPPETGGEPPFIFGDTYLYRIDKVTGIATRVGNTGRADWMDLAFDSHGRLWTTTDNELYLLNTQTGASTFVANIVGVPQSNIPGVPPEDWPWTEVMTLAFDENDVLWATTMKGFSNSLGNGIVLRIDVNTGQATVVGYTGKPYNHGGDIMPTRVRVCHKVGNGRYNTITIAIDALQAHIAHGDIVPGTAGNSCDCP